VLRDAMATDPLNPAGIYFGTRSGQLWGSSDGGASWSLIRGGLPPIVCVKAAVVGEVAKARVPGARAAATPAARRPRGGKTAARRPSARAKRAKGARRAAPRRGAARKKK
jgi:hypothetical protein